MLSYVAKLEAKLPMIKVQPSTNTNSISLKGIEIIMGDSIIIPIDIKTLATTKSMTINGM